MKKIIGLVLCILLAGCMLVSCSEEEIGGYLDNYDYTPEVIENVTLNMYIIGDPASSENAIVTVKNYVQQYTLDKFNTTLNLFYVDESEYEEKVMAAVQATDATKADIVLINSVDLMNKLCPVPVAGATATNYLQDLSSLLATNKFGQLNTAIASSLLEGSVRDGKYYCIPNNHVIGAYEYLIIDKSVARDHYNFSPSTLAGYTTLEEAAALIEALRADGKTDAEIENVVKIVSGDYAAKAAYEKAGYYCNISKYPEVDEAEAYSSAFGVVAGANAERALEIIYALNIDVYFRNLLQYGVEGTNFYVDDNGVITGFSSGDSTYKMNLLYTGDVFKAYYSEAFGWTAEIAANGVKQNDDSIVYVPPVPETPEDDGDTDGDTTGGDTTGGDTTGGDTTGGDTTGV